LQTHDGIRTCIEEFNVGYVADMQIKVIRFFFRPISYYLL